MRASRETFQSQEVIECDLCQKPVTFFCRPCWLNLCDSCVPKHLRATRKAKTIHVVVDYMRKDDHDTCFCESHPNHECSAYCKTCDCPSCILCVCIKHKSHDIFELSDNVDVMNDIPRENVRLISPKHDLETFRLIDITEKLPTFFLIIMLAINVYYVYQCTVNGNVKKFQQELDDVKKENEAVLQKQREIEELVKKLERKILPATLYDRKILEAPSVSSVIYTGFHGGQESYYLCDMAVTDDKRVWVGGSSRESSGELKLFDLQGTLHRTVPTPRSFVSICMYNKHVVFGDFSKKAVMKVSQDGTVVTMFTTGYWEPVAITESVSGDLLVSLVKDNESKVVRYSSTGTVLNEIQYDSQGKPPYHWALSITENVNGDIIVTDPKNGIVTAVDRLGIFRYSYSGKESTFSPLGVVTDSVGHVLVADRLGNKIHMLDRDGRFLTYIIPEGGIKEPHALAMINDGELIIGEWGTGLAKTIKYLEVKN